MKVLAKTPIFYNGKRYEKETELDIRKDVFDERLFENLEEDTNENDNKDNAPAAADDKKGTEDKENKEK